MTNLARRFGFKDNNKSDLECIYLTVKYFLSIERLVCVFTMDYYNIMNVNNSVGI